jgi:hypothetical protein
MRQRKTALGQHLFGDHHLHQISQAQFEPKTPTHTRSTMI